MDKQEKAAHTRLLNKIRKYMWVDGGHRSAPERNGVLHGSDIDLYHSKALEMREIFSAMSAEERARLMAQAFPLPKPYDELTEEEQATARYWDWSTYPHGPFVNYYCVSAVTDTGIDTERYDGPLERVRQAAREWSDSKIINVVTVSTWDDRGPIARFVKGREEHE